MAGCDVSGASMASTSHHSATSPTLFTASPAASAFARLLLDAGNPTQTFTPLSFKLRACACPWDPYPTMATFFEVIASRFAPSS
jgi:hypothetical protein